MIDNLLDAFDEVDPSKITVKSKLHTLTHLPSDIRRFGLAVRSSTEVFEAFNAIFRYCVVLSNRQADSRDVARKFRSMDAMKHLLTGGYFEQDGVLQQAGPAVREILKNAPVIQQHLGWTPLKTPSPGRVFFCT
jgi:hypothetical protein